MSAVHIGKSALKIEATNVKRESQDASKGKSGIKLNLNLN
jgi:hypothetical protein